METGKKYKLTEELARAAFPAEQNIVEDDINVARGGRITLSEGTELEVLGIDGANRALLLILTGEFSGMKVSSSPRTQSVFEEIR